MRAKRAERSLLRNYAEQIDALGLWRWVTFKVQRVRSRRAPVRQEFSVRTPLAEYPLIFRAHTSDTNVFSQIFIHREYRCLDDVADAGLIIDCGANVGYSSAYLLSRYPLARLIAIEPDPSNYEILCKNLQPYGSRCTTMRSAVWSSSVPLVVSADQPGSQGEWMVTVRQATDGEKPTIEAVDIGTLLSRTGSDRISILKVDIEGSEAEVFAFNTEAWIDKVDNIVIELHGQVCYSVFMAAIDGKSFEISESEELTVCKRTALY